MTEPTARPALAAGTYRNGGGGGLHPLRRDAEGRWTVGEPYPDAPNASFGVHAVRHGLHYLCDEQAEGRIGVHRHDGRRWHRLASVPTGGADPCHLALDPTETLLAVANYTSGSVSLFRLDERSGRPIAPARVHAHRGAGPNRRRQDAPHAHWVGFSPDARWLYQTDLGTDEVLAFPLDRTGRWGTPQVAYAAPPGSGPRHLLLHPRLGHRAYLASELASTLTVLDRAEGSFTARRLLSTLPGGWVGENIVAHLAMNQAGDRLYVSNRGHDSIAVFALDAAGMPTPMQHVAAGGTSPRFFLLIEEERLMVIANEQGQTVTMLAIGADGGLSPTGVVLPIPGVAWVTRIEAER